jgi:hypothetical protein
VGIGEDEEGGIRCLLVLFDMGEIRWRVLEVDVFGRCGA